MKPKTPVVLFLADAVEEVAVVVAHVKLAPLWPWPRSAELERLIGAWRDEDALHLVLERLDHAAVVALAAAVLGATVGAKLQQQLESTGGNPLFVRGSA